MPTVHFAANSLVGESMVKPLLYFNNNVYGMQILLESMVKHNIKNIVEKYKGNLDIRLNDDMLEITISI